MKNISRIMIFCQFVIFVIISSCATNDKILNKEAPVAVPISITTGDSIHEAETIEAALTYIKEKMIYKQIYLSDLIAITSRQDLLYKNCSQIFEDLPSDLSQYQTFINNYRIDDGKTFSFLTYQKKGYSITGYRCDNVNDLGRLESDFYDCFINKDTSKCFSLAIVHPEQSIAPDKVKAMKKNALVNICKTPNDICDFFNELVLPRKTRNNLTIKEKNTVNAVIEKLRKAKNKERLSEHNEKKKEERYENDIIVCRKGNAQTCWNLYVANLDKNAEIANNFVALACEFGLKKACIADERYRQIIHEKDQQKLQQEALEQQQQRLKYEQDLDKQRQVQSEYRDKQQQEANERKENAEISTGVANVFSSLMFQKQQERIKQTEDAREVRKRQQEKLDQDFQNNRTRYTDCRTEPDGSVHCESR